jgi:hypothetical protein
VVQQRTQLRSGLSGRWGLAVYPGGGRGIDLTRRRKAKQVRLGHGVLRLDQENRRRA